MTITMVEKNKEVAAGFKKLEVLTEDVFKMTRMMMEKSKEDDVGACFKRVGETLEEDVSKLTRMMMEKNKKDVVGLKKLETLKQDASKLTRLMMEKNKEDDMGACIKKLDKMRWEAKEPIYDTALLLFGQSANYRKLWLYLKPNGMKRCKWENDDYICHGHILNGMSDALFDVHQNVGLTKELWDQLESKYMAKDASSKKFLVSNFNNYKMVDSSGKGKGKEIVGSSSVNMIEDGKNKNNNKNTKGKKRNNDGNNDGSNRKSKLTCWKCGKTGHFKRDCRVKKNNVGNTFGLGQGSKDPNPSQGLNFNFDVIPFNHYVSHIYEICYVQNDAFAWWIDSGATCHSCKDRCWFKTFHPVQDGSVLHIGDKSTKPIFGRGNVVLEFSSRKTITLVNVVYVSGLRKNLMSSPVLNKYGYKQVYESDKYISSRHGVFVGFGYYNNGMFMLNLNKVPNTFSSVCMISSKDVDSSMWHARLGHVHYKRIKKYVVTFIDDASRFCYVYLCHAKDEALDKFKIYKTEFEAVKRKILGEKGIDCIFIGYAEHSKAYRFYVIEPNEFISVNLVIESRDAMFDEKRFTSIPRPKSLMPSSNEDQIVEGSRDEIGTQYSYCYSKEEDPRTFDEAMKSHDVSFWKEAINDEMDSIMENNTWIYLIYHHVVNLWIASGSS
ncbi:zinc finger, CCHC-type containing protein [Tanacetum coccineum]